ncbi:SDR family NAD(P)-dependent oxidoreductase [Actinoplanes rectilineatus]|uniref:SDR family NAD(P)-dependent oxidoreductase n=1 Tax=Actinoplanes rectilineatus TaxID=113571 RepID=UPI0005F2793A|nr:SDR family oxidoreductase [Actinoplanes rectilineatus]
MTNTAVITGGAGGMGLATAKLLGADHRVVIADLSQERLDAAVAELTSDGIEARSAVCDITDRASVEKLLDHAGSGGHHVRALVHAAGVSPQMGSADLVARVNGTGTVHVTRAFLARAGEGDVLVNVASVAGHQLPRILLPIGAFRLAETDPAGFERAIVRRARVGGRKLHSGIAYGISKAFVLWYTRSQAVAFGKRGARIVSVSPGSFDTAMGRLEADHGAADLLKVSAIKRFGKPEEIAAVLAFCAGTAPGYLTGVDILVDGGTQAGTEFKKRPGVTN